MILDSKGDLRASIAWGLTGFVIVCACFAILAKVGVFPSTSETAEIDAAMAGAQAKPISEVPVVAPPPPPACQFHVDTKSRPGEVVISKCCTGECRELHAEPVVDGLLLPFPDSDG